VPEVRFSWGGGNKSEPSMKTGTRNGASKTGGKERDAERTIEKRKYEGSPRDENMLSTCSPRMVESAVGSDSFYGWVVS